MPGTDTLRTLAELTDPVAVALFERMASADAEVTLRATTDRPRTFDLAHLCDIHGRLFGDVYEWAGQPRYVDIGKPGQTGDPFLHRAWIQTYSAAVADQIRAERNLADQRDPGVWADRAAHHWQAMLHAHPFREGNGRATRIWLEDLAAEAGHTLDWSRSHPARKPPTPPPPFARGAGRGAARRPGADARPALPGRRRKTRRGPADRRAG